MGLELAKWSDHTASKDNPYTNLLQTAISSIGSRYGFRIPDLLLTMQYKLDAKGIIMRHPEPKLVFQPNGPNDAQLNFRHHTLEFKYTGHVCRFWVSMDALYGEGVVIKRSVTVGGTGGIGKSDGPKGEIQVGGELGDESPGTRTSLHARIEGMLSAKENRLEAWGQLV